MQTDEYKHWEMKLAARAAGHEGIDLDAEYSDALGLPAPGHHRGWWHPLADDGDSRRLQIDLGMKLEPHDDTWVAVADGCVAVERIEDCPHQAARKAVVSCAARVAISKGLDVPEWAK